MQSQDEIQNKLEDLNSEVWRKVNSLGSEKKKYLFTGSVAVILVFSMFFAQNSFLNNTTEQTDFEPPESPRDYPTSLSVADQKLENGSLEVTAQYSKPYYIVIHQDKSGSPGKIISVSEVVAGRVTEKSIDVDIDISQGTSFYAVLHDFGGEQEFDPKNDPPVVEDGETVLNVFQIEEQ